MAMAMTLRLTDADEDILAELAARDGVSREEAAVRAIRETASHLDHQGSVSELSARGRARYSSLLDRLGR